MRRSYFDVQILKVGGSMNSLSRRKMKNIGLLPKLFLIFASFLVFINHCNAQDFSGEWVHKTKGCYDTEINQKSDECNSLTFTDLLYIQQKGSKVCGIWYSSNSKRDFCGHLIGEIEGNKANVKLEADYCQHYPSAIPMENSQQAYLELERNKLIWWDLSKQNMKSLHGKLIRKKERKMQKQISVIDNGFTENCLKENNADLDKSAPQK